MNGGRLKSEPPSGLTGSPLPPPAARANRLSRSFRQSQQSRSAAEPDSPRTPRPDFKTPTRIPGPRAGAGFSGESPHNDSDFQQDIIWDATSPSPNRRGKRGRKQRVGVVSISEIVSRIAPKHGRPEVAEPTLQQWIGDSATIPCTPDVQAPKPKKKSPRPNGVDDLLKLAKQFDFNMFRQDEEEVEEVEEVEEQHQQSLELLSDDILDLEDDFSASLPGNHQPPSAAAAAPTAQPHQHEDDDLDFLFDGPTQRVSGNFSQVTSAQPSQVKPSAASPKEASGKTSSSSRPLTSTVSTTTPKAAAGNDEFEDDWANDDLLDDSLVLEMTQNPQNFMAPWLCSTQKPSVQSRPHRSPVSRAVGQSAASKAERDTGRQRATFRLESSPHPPVTRVQTDSWSTSKPVHGSQRSGQTSGPQKPQIPPKTSAGAKTVPAAAASSRPAAADLLDDDLDSLFSCEPVWDDLADDELLCEMCEDVENQIQTAGNVSAKPPPPVAHLTNQRAALQPASWSRAQPANQKLFTPKQTPPSSTWAAGRAAGSSLAAGVVSNFTAGVRTNVDSFRLAQTKNTSGSTNRSTYVQETSRVQQETSRVHQETSRVHQETSRVLQETSRVHQETSRVHQETSRVLQETSRVLQETSRVHQETSRVHQETSRVQHGSTSKDQFTFKRPNNPVSMATSKAAAQCSAAEIELKKQQAMERRRQRLQAQNLRAPT